MASALHHVEMTGSDNRMDQQGNFELPVNSLPAQCPRCTLSDLDFIVQPYRLAKGVNKPTDMELAELANFFVREKARQILETVVPNQCRFFPTHELKTGAATP